MRSFTRRGFLATGLATAVAGSRLNASMDTIQVGVMGAGGRGTSLAKSFAGMPNMQLAMMAEPDAKNSEKAAEALKKAGLTPPEFVKDFRTILDNKAIDVFVCAAPNHWHAPAGILACAAGKHCYIEKPCSHTPQEGEWLAAAAKKHQRVVQMGNQRRSAPKIIEAIAKLHEGVIGNVYFAQAWYTANRGSIGIGKPADPPAGLDYDMWQGPCTRIPYRSNYLHYNWHWFWHWGNGELGNNGVHMIDLLRWGLNVSLPNKVTSAGGRYRFKDDQQTPDTHMVSFDFPEGKTVTWEGFSCNALPHHKQVDCLFQGEKGSLVIHGAGYSTYDEKGKETFNVKESLNENLHFQNFLAAVRGEAKPNSEITEGAKSTLLCHLGNIAHRVGRSIVCDPTSGKIKDDTEAMKYWSKEYAPGWQPKV